MLLRVKSPAASIQALAATARLANLPSVVSNITLGLVLGYPGAAAGIVALAILTGSALYLAGGFFNDWADREWDARHRPERGLPAGLFDASAYLTAGSLFALVGLVAAALAGWKALAIAFGILISIGIYTWLHKKSVWSVVPMGFCRGLLPALGVAATGQSGVWPVTWIAGCGLMAHVAGISWLARSESRQVRGTAEAKSTWFFPICMFLMVSGSLFFHKLAPLGCLLALIPYALWTGIAVLWRRLGTGARVSALLAGIPLVDWMVLLPLFLAGQAPAAALLVPPLAFAAGRLAQRVTPAT